MNRSLRTLGALAVGIAASTVFTGCGVIGGRIGDIVREGTAPTQTAPQGETGTTGEGTTGAGTPAVRPPLIAFGQCTDLAWPEEDSDVYEIPAVDCAQLHKWEAYAAKEFGLDEAFPGKAAVTTMSDEFCLREFEAFVGVGYEDSRYEFWYLYPSKGSWADDDRTVVCFIGLESGGIGGSLRDAEA